MRSFERGVTDVRRQFRLSRIGRTVLGVSALTGVSLMVAGPAEAATAGTAAVVGTTVQYTAAGSKTNTVTATRSGRVVTIDDKVTVKAGKGCKAVKGDVTKVRCTTARTPTRIVVSLGDRNDTLVNKSDLRVNAYGGGGNDTLTGGSGDDYLDGGAGHDRLTGAAGNDRIDGKSGNDRLDGGRGFDELIGYSGNDRVYGGPDADNLHEGNDPSGPDADFLSGGAGDDSVLYHLRDKAVTADADGVIGDDGTKGERDTIATDVETLYGGFGNDKLKGTARRNILLGGDGNDNLTGLGGDDVLDGGRGADLLDGGPGDDDLTGDEDYEGSPVWADVIRGGSGNDTVGYAYRSRAVTADLDGQSRDDGQAGEHDTLGADIENLVGSDGGDRLTGNAASNDIDGGAGNDTILGGAGADRMDGGGGNDTVRGGAGDDELYGDVGRDTVHGDAGDDNLYSGDGSDEGDGATDHLDGGANGAVGDYCAPWAPDTTVSCERLWPEPPNLRP
jgi:Ca2+-binding RTX toxin-like protein